MKKVSYWLCNKCLRRFMVDFEPDMNEEEAAAHGVELAPVKFCPVCGSEDIGEED